MNRTEITQLQQRLVELGYNPGPVDGWYGEKTKAAYRAYQDSQGPEVPKLTPAPQIPWYLHRSVLGVLATIIASVAGLFGVVVDSGPLTDVLTQTGTLVFAVMALIGTIYQKGEIRGRYTKSAVASTEGGADNRSQSDSGRPRLGVPTGHSGERKRTTDPPGWNG